MRRSFRTLAVTSLVAAALMLSAIPVSADPDQAWLGVFTQTVDKNMAKAFNLGADQGAIVNSIIDNSPADDAGLEEDDIIVGFNGKKVSSDDQLIELISAAKPGDEAILKVVRGTKEREIKVTLETRRDRSAYNFSFGSSPRAPKVYTHRDGDESHGYLGVYLIDISAETAEALGARRGGVIINELEEGSPAEQAGLKPGDVVIAIGDESVRDSDELTDIVRDMKEGDKAAVKVIRGGKETTVEVAVAERESSVWYAGNNVFTIPNLSGLYNLDIDPDDLRFESDKAREEWKEAMNELREELDELRDELRELRREGGRK